MSRYSLTLNGKDYVVEIANIAGTAATVIVNGTPYNVEVPAGITTAAATPVAAAPVAAAPAPAAPVAAAPVAAAPAPATAPAAPAAPAAGAGEPVVAPMPGTVISLSVSEGDTVEVGDTVLVMEAMKMENEIKAHVAGTVSQILATVGQDVGVNEAMLIIG